MSSKCADGCEVEFIIDGKVLSYLRVVEDALS